MSTEVVVVDSILLLFRTLGAPMEPFGEHVSKDNSVCQSDRHHNFSWTDRPIPGNDVDEIFK